MAARHEEKCYKDHFHIFSCLQRTMISKNDVEVARGIVFQEIRPRAGLKVSEFVKTNLGGLPKNDSILFSGQC